MTLSLSLSLAMDRQIAAREREKERERERERETECLLQQLPPELFDLLGGDAESRIRTPVSGNM